MVDADTAAWRIQVDDGEAHEVKKHTVEQHQRQLAETRVILGDKLHLYQVACSSNSEACPSLIVARLHTSRLRSHHPPQQIHSATEASGVLTDPDVLDALATLRDQGVAVGASVSFPQGKPLELATAATSADAKPLFASVQATYNLLDQSAGPLLEAAAAQGVFVIIKEGVANGRLTARNIGSQALELLEAEAAKLSTTPDALALAWILTQPFVGMVLSGASTCEQLRSNVAALKLVPLEPALHERLGKALAQECEQYWQDRRNLAWN